MADRPLNPIDLDFLARVLARCVSDDHSHDERDHIAARIISAFQSGITDEEQLVETARRLAGR